MRGSTASAQASGQRRQHQPRRPAARRATRLRCNQPTKAMPQQHQAAARASSGAHRSPKVVDQPQFASAGRRARRSIRRGHGGHAPRRQAPLVQVFGECVITAGMSPSPCTTTSPPRAAGRYQRFAVRCGPATRDAARAGRLGCHGLRGGGTGARPEVRDHLGHGGRQLGIGHGNPR